MNQSSAQYCQISGSECVFSGVILGENDLLPFKKSYKETTISEVKFERSNIKAIPKELFKYFPYLDTLNMRYQNVKVIKDNTFANA